MRLFFVHDHPFYRENDKVYSGGSFPYFLWDSYLPYFQKIRVYGRKSRNKKNKVIESSAENVSFFLTEHYTSIFSIVSNYRKIRRELKDNMQNADVVLVRLPSILGFIAAYVAFSSHKKIIVEQVGSAYEAMNTHGTLVGKIAAPFFEWINRRIVKRADYVSYVTLSKLQLDYPTSGFNSAISDVILNRVLEPNEIDYAKFHLPVFRIGLIGGFDARYKGQDMLLKAVSQLGKDIKDNIELYFVGKGDSTWLENEAATLQLSENIKFIGAKESGKEIFDFLSSLSLYVQPSLTEGMPRALLEAMSVGCPVLGSDVGGIPDVLDEGLRHTPKDFNKLSNQIACFYNNRQVLVEESDKNLSRIRPFLKSQLDENRMIFYKKIIKDLRHD